jgi:hypothetical protein
MGVFRKLVKKNTSADSSKSSHGTIETPQEQTPLAPPMTSPTPSPLIPENGRKVFRRGETFPPLSFSSSDPKMDVVPKLVDDLRNAKDTSSEKPAKALRSLFALTEHHSENRMEMVHAGDLGLVPTILDFMQRCEIGSSEQYLTLLVLNNISIPRENKRVRFHILFK